MMSIVSRNKRRRCLGVGITLSILSISFMFWLGGGDGLSNYLTLLAIFNSDGGDQRVEVQAVYDQFDNNRQLSVEDDHTARKLIVELAGNKTLDQRDPDRWAVSVYCFIMFSILFVGVIR